jgi:putative ATPase
MLNALEVAVHLARAERDGATGIATVEVGVGHVEEALQERTLTYDRAGAEHYGVVSAFIKSMRGSDPDAAVYWMTRMLEAGEDPRFVLRRMVIFAAEDVGLADPQALALATAALSAVELVGMPEGVLPMTEAALYLACAPKSNTALTTYAAARRAVRESGTLPVPMKLLPATTGVDRAVGHGRGYRYPHEFAGHYVAETYLPDELAGSRFYSPSDSGLEREIAVRVARWREQVTAGTSAAPAGHGSSGPPERSSPERSSPER